MIDKKWFYKKTGSLTAYSSSPFAKDREKSEIKLLHKENWGELRGYDITQVRFPDANTAIVFDDVEETVELIEAGFYELREIAYRPSLVKIETRKSNYKETQECSKRILTKMNAFLKGRAEVKRLTGVSKYAFLLHGQPGTGKSSLVRNIVNNEIKEDMIVIWCGGDILPPSEMMELLNRDPRLKVFVFEELTMISSNPGTLQEFLTFMDGELSPTNSLIFGTTNFPAALEKNLADRPGRFDHVEEILPLNQSEVYEFFETFMERKLTDEEKTKLETKESLTVAHIQKVVMGHTVFGMSLEDSFKDVLKQKKQADKAFAKYEKKIGFN